MHESGVSTTHITPVYDGDFFKSFKTKSRRKRFSDTGYAVPSPWILRVSKGNERDGLVLCWVAGTNIRIAEGQVEETF